MQTKPLETWLKHEQTKAFKFLLREKEIIELDSLKADSTSVFKTVQPSIFELREKCYSYWQNVIFRLVLTVATFQNSVVKLYKTSIMRPKALDLKYLISERPINRPAYTLILINTQSIVIKHTYKLIKLYGKVIFLFIS